MRKSIFTIFILLFATTFTQAQVGIGTTTPNGSAQLDVNSTNKGFLPPRMTSAQRIGITSPVAGLMVYQTDGTAGLYYYDGSAWIYIINTSTSSMLPVANGGTGVTSSTGTGNLVLSTSPILTTPIIASGNSQWAQSLTITPTTHGTSQRAAIWIDGWSLLQDIQGNGTKNFSIGQTVTGSTTTYPARLVINTVGNIGIGNETPNARLDIRTNPTSTTDPGTGFLGIGTTTTAANTAGAGAVRYNTIGAIEYSNGSSWVTLSNPNFGDIKTGIQSADHNGWVRLNGRLKSSLATTQQAQATALGIGTNLPDATNAFLVQNGTTLGSVSGSNQRNLTQANLPNVNFPTATSSSAGSHSHTVDPGTVTTGLAGAHSHTGSVGGSNWNGGGAYAGGFAAGGFGFFTPTLTINSAGDHTHSVVIPSTTSSTAVGHTHTVSVSSGGSSTPIDIVPISLSINTFIYLGN